MTLLRQASAALLLVGALAGCAPATSAPGGVIAQSWARPASVTQFAAEVRARGGMVVVVETVSMSEVTTSRVATGITDVFLAQDEAVFTVRITDSLGESAPVGTLLQVEAAVSPEEVVDASGAPRTDWVVSGGSPLGVQLPPSSGSYVLYAFHTPRETERSRWVARVDGAMVDGDMMRDPTDQSVESLRR
jgi:hypothetical protein